MGATTTEVKFRLAMEGASVVQTDLKRVQAGFGEVKDSFSSVKQAAQALGIALAVDKLLEHTKAIINAGDAMNDLSQRTGIAIKDLAKYELATSQSGTSMESLAKGIKGLSVNLVEHGKELRAAGLSATTADGAMRQLADLFQKMPDGIDKTALAVKVFGKSGMDLIPMLNMGAKGLDDAAEKSAKYAATMALLAPQADKFNDNMAEIALYSKIAGMNMMNDAMPALLKITQAMAEAAQKGGTLKGIMAGLNAGFDNYWTNVKNFYGVKSQKGGATGSWGPNTGGATGGWDSSDSKTTAKQDKIIADAKAFAARLRAALGGDGAATASEYQKLNEAMDRELRLAEEELKLGGKLTASDKYRVETIDKVTDAYLAGKMSAEEWAKASAKALVVSEKMKASETLQAAAKAALEIAKERADLWRKESDGIDAYMRSQSEGYAASVKGAQDASLAAQNEYEQLGMTKSQIAEITLLKLQEMQVSEKGGIEAVAYREKEIAAIKEQIGWLKKTEIKQDTIDAETESAKAAAEERKHGWEETDRIARDIFVTWGDDGKNAAQKITDTFKKGLLSAIYEAQIRPLTLGIYNAVTGGPSGAGNALGAASGLNTLAGIGSAYSIGSGFSKFAATSVGKDMGLWSAGNNPSAAGLTETGAAWSQGLTTAASVLGYADAFSAAAGGKWGTAAGEAIGTYLLPGVGTLIGKAIGAALDNAFAGEMRAGGQYTYSAASGTAFAQGPSGGQIMGADVQRAINDTVGTINNLLKGVGSAARLAGFQAGLESSGDNRGGVYSGGTFTTGATFGESGKGNNYNGTLYESTSTQSPDAQTAMANFATDLTQATLEALQAATDIPKTISDMLAGRDVEAMTAQAATELLNTIDAVVATVTDFNTVAKTLPFANLTSLSFDMAAGLIAAAGGMQTLGTNLATYYDKFYNEAEKRAQTIKNINAAVSGAGVTGFDASSASRDQYRALVDAQDATTTSGQKAYAALISVAGAFDQLTPVAAAAQVATRSAADILSERTRLQDQLDTLTMTGAQLSGKARSALDASNQGLYDQVQAAQAAKDANDALAQSQKDATAAADQLAATNKTWQDQIDVLMGSQTEHSIALRDASNDSTRALMNQVYAMQTASSEMDGLTKTVLGLVAGIHTSVADSIFGMNYGLADSAGKYGMLDQQAKQFDDLMRSSSDITLIAKYAQGEIDTINKAFALLDPSQQSSTLDQNTLLLTRIDSYVSGAGADAVSRKRADNAELSAAVAKAVKEAMADLATAQTNAAIAQANAASKLESIVRKPAVVHLLVSNSTDKEVSLG